jgi:spore maturation protein CgeB
MRASFGRVLANFCDVKIAASAFPILNKLWWKFDRLLPHADKLEAAVIAAVAGLPSPLVLTTGLASIREAALKACRDRGATLAHFSSDDPWNPGVAARWHFDALRQYDVVFTPRRSNLGDFARLGVREARWLPFGYDADLLSGEPDRTVQEAADVLFVGGADKDRVDFFDRFCATGLQVKVVGGYWQKFRNMHRCDLGQRSPAEVAALTRASKISIILVRRANRDGHTMRSFEAGAIGGCLLVEDTNEHRYIFGVNDETVRYFTSPEDAADIARALLADSASRARLAAAVRQRVTGNANTYADRLREMIEIADSARQGRQRCVG